MSATSKQTNLVGSNRTLQNSKKSTKKLTNGLNSIDNKIFNMLRKFSVYANKNY